VAYIVVREQVRLMISAWITQLLPAHVGADLADDLADLVKLVAAALNGPPAAFRAHPAP